MITHTDTNMALGDWSKGIVLECMLDIHSVVSLSSNTSSDLFHMASAKAVFDANSKTEET